MARRRSQSGEKSNLMWRRLMIWGTPTAIVAAAVAFKTLSPNPESDAAGPLPNAATARQDQGLKGNAPANADAAGKPAPAGQVSPNPNAQIVAMINGEEISRAELSRECMSRFGKPVIESMINKSLISQHCTQQGVKVTDQDVRVEIDRLARKFGLTYEDYLKMLKQERNITPQQYSNEIIWPMLALRQMAKKNIEPTATEINQAIESKFGESVKARIIVVEDAQTAQRVQAEAAAQPQEFGNLARKYSKDPSASLNGLIQPIRHHIGDPQLEKAAFALADGQVSQVVQLNLPGTKPDAQGSVQYVILKSEGRLPAQQINRATIEPSLREAIVERKLQREATQIFGKIEKQAETDKAIVNVYNDPNKRSLFPGVAARIYQDQITLAQLQEECVQRHGVEVLESVIHRRLLAQSLKEKNLNVTQDDIETEVAHAAILMGKVDANKRPDLKGWLKMVTEESGVSEQVYIEDSVWPSTALKKLSGQVKVSDEDLQKGYEANYGVRVRARAIVHNNLRKAQEIWELARQTPTADNFAKLAEEYSVDPSSRALQGKIPPIERHGGQPLIEKEAFALKPGELSGIINMGEHYVILFCEGFTEPNKVTFEEVKQSIYDDVHEKKQRIVMGQTFHAIKEKSRIDNYLAGTTHSPNRKANYQEALENGKAAPAGKGATIPRNPATTATPGTAPRR